MTRRSVLLVGAVTLTVVLALVVAILVNADGSSDESSTNRAEPTPAEVAAIATAVTSVPQSALERVGPGAATSFPTPVDGTQISIDGKPEVLYIGAEYCPFCAAERWPLAIALARFGTFTGLGVTTSSNTDVHPNTPTLTFRDATYTSDVLAFTAVEVATNQPDGRGGYMRLDTPTPDQLATIDELSPGGAIPFVDLGGRYLVSGATFDVGVFEGLDAWGVAAALTQPGSEIEQSVLGSANTITAALCALTDNRPANVCTSPTMTAMATQLST